MYYFSNGVSSMSKKILKPEWKSIKTEIESYKRKELILLIKNLYDLNDENKELIFIKLNALNSIQLISDDFCSKIVIQTKKRIRKCFFNNNRVKLSEAKLILSSFNKSTNSINLRLDMMLYYCEVGTDCGATYGAKYEALYTSVESVFEKFVKHVQKLELKNQKIFKTRVKDLIAISCHCGFAHEEILRQKLDEWPICKKI